MQIQLTMQPRAGVGELIDDYAEGRIDYSGLQQAIAALGYSTTSTYEMVRHITPKRNA